MKLTSALGHLLCPVIRRPVNRHPVIVRRVVARMLGLSPVDVSPRVDVSTVDVGLSPVGVSPVDFWPDNFSNTDALSSAGLRRLQARLAAPRYRQTGPTDRPDLPTYRASERRRSLKCDAQHSAPTDRPTRPTDLPDLPTDRTYRPTGPPSLRTSARTCCLSYRTDQKKMMKNVF
jgi:hypothetical protein